MTLSLCQISHLGLVALTGCTTVQVYVIDAASDSASVDAQDTVPAASDADASQDALQGPLDVGAGAHVDCSDDITCTVDRSIAGQCQHVPVNSICPWIKACGDATCDNALGCVYSLAYLPACNQ